MTDNRMSIASENNGTRARITAAAYDQPGPDGNPVGGVEVVGHWESDEDGDLFVVEVTGNLPFRVRSHYG